MIPLDYPHLGNPALASLLENISMSQPQSQAFLFVSSSDIPMEHTTISGMPEFINTTTSISNNSSDEAEEHHLGIIDERRKRRMISNRESARRSRMRKQRHLDELCSQVLRLRTQNHRLLDKLNHVSESHGRVVQENARLKEETSNLRKMLMDLQIGNNQTILRGFEDISCNNSLSHS